VTAAAPGGRLLGMRRLRVLLLLVAVSLIGGSGVLIAVLHGRSVRRLEAIQTRLADVDRIRELRHRLQGSLLASVGLVVPRRSYLVEDIRLQVDQALSLDGFLDSRTNERLERVQSLLAGPDLVPRSTLSAALDLVTQVSEAEATAQADLLLQVRSNARNEVILGIAGLTLLTAIVLLAVWLLPRRLSVQLVDLRRLLSGLADGESHEIETGDVDPELRPLFENYNVLVRRLGELEALHRERESTLEEEVRAASRALLAQHRTLANAERLAAVGETAAGVAHELRNPLAGALTAIENLRREAAGESRERLDLVAHEIERVVERLKRYLEDARHRPEEARRVDVAGLVTDLLRFLRYQAPAAIRLESRVAPGTACTLPPDRFRQALLNLVLNSMEALDGEGEVRIEGRVEEGRLTLEVIDDGPGFPARLLGQGVRPFATERSAGTGLGLAIVRRTVHDAGGTIELSNAPGGGAVVTLRVPCGAS